MAMDKTAIDEFFARQPGPVALQFSSGKDSAACLWLLEPWWDRLDVVWGNPGNPYPETLAYMERIRKIVPRFVEVGGQQPASIRAKGWPVDILPVEGTAVGVVLGFEPAAPLRMFHECCWENLWQPMQEFLIRGGYTGVIRGQKLSDRLKSPTRSGDVEAGVEYLFPIETWSHAEVFDFLGPSRLPESYKRGLSSSLDCINCTAYTSENPGRLGELKLTHPAVYTEVVKVHLNLHSRLRAHAAYLESCHDQPTI
jgi:3'-phosphoadenosine 5'-phosphosulfate sulfotransferase (PAPS reductase)/FAD synthetase